MSGIFNPGTFAILGFDGVKPGGDFIELMERYPPSGFLLLAHNYKDPDLLGGLISKLKGYAGSGAIFAVDQEPGRVQRFKEYFPPCVIPEEFVDDGDTDIFRRWCADTAFALSDIGINLNFAPVLDLCSFEKKYPVLNGRAFGGDTDVVSRFAEILIEEHHKNNVLVCGKHFPGLGSAKFDPHNKLAVSDEPLTRFRRYHWAPFRHAVKQGIDMVMTTHLLAPSMDERNPATCSSIVVDYLINELKFHGPVISDDLVMEGAGGIAAIEQSALDAITAGHNLIIISRDVGIQLKVMESLKKRYEDDESFRKIADANEKKIKQVRDKIRDFKPRR